MTFGPMVAIADDKELYLLEFADRRGLEREVERLRKKTHSAIVPGRTKTIKSIEDELHQYFGGKLDVFKTPVRFLGSPFQMSVWETLQNIPCGETRSYAEIASSIRKPSAFRAVANSNGKMGGYGGGVTRKQWLLEHEKSGEPEGFRAH